MSNDKLRRVDHIWERGNNIVKYKVRNNISDTWQQYYDTIYATADPDIRDDIEAFIEYRGKFKNLLNFKEI